MKAFVVVALVSLAIVAAEPPRPRAFSQQQVAAPASPPYRPRGFRPSPAFNLPLRSLPQQAYGAPAPSYGPPPQPAYIPPANAEPTTTPVPTTTEYSTEEITTEPQSENFAVESQNRSPKKDKSVKQEQDDRRPVFFVLPQRIQAQPQKLLYTIQQNAGLVAVEQPKALVYSLQSSAPLVALPAAEVAAPLQLLPASGSASTTSVVTPYSSSFVQVFQ